MNLIESTWRALERSAAAEHSRASPHRGSRTVTVLAASIAAILIAALLPLTLFIDPSGRSLIVYPPWVDERAALADVIAAGGSLIGVRSDLPLGIVGVAAAFPQNSFGGRGLRLPLILPFGCIAIARSGS